MHGYIIEAKSLYKKLLKLQPNHSIAKKEFSLIKFFVNLWKILLVF